MAFVFGANDYRLYLRKDGLYYSLSTGSTETWLPGDIIRLEAVGVEPGALNVAAKRESGFDLHGLDREPRSEAAPGVGIYSRAGGHLAIDNWEGGNLGPMGTLGLDSATETRGQVCPGILWRPH